MMIPPIFIIGRDGDVEAFVSVADAEAAMESQDVKAGEYVGGFDATGTRLAIEVTEPTRRSRRRLVRGISTVTLTSVRVRPISEARAGAEELKRLLALKLADPSPDSDLAVLVQRALETDKRRRNLPESSGRKALVAFFPLLVAVLLVVQAKRCESLNEEGHAVSAHSPRPLADLLPSESSRLDGTSGESCEGSECPVGWDCVPKHRSSERHCVLRCGLDGGCPQGYACNPKTCIHLDGSAICDGTDAVPGGYCHRRL
jgi:hypothetical protein